eukprot:Amastigsp_a843819_42.p2 type:complete len:428 gc:universal Amastigsp_a843819_42:1413-2696(+)
MGETRKEHRVLELPPKTIDELMADVLELAIERQGNNTVLVDRATSDELEDGFALAVAAVVVHDHRPEKPISDVERAIDCGRKNHEHLGFVDRHAVHGEPDDEGVIGVGTELSLEHVDFGAEKIGHDVLVDSRLPDETAATLRERICWQAVAVPHAHSLHVRGLVGADAVHEHGAEVLEVDPGSGSGRLLADVVDSRVEHRRRRRVAKSFHGVTVRLRLQVLRDTLSVIHLEPLVLDEAAGAPLARHSQLSRRALNELEACRQEPPTVLTWGGEHGVESEVRLREQRCVAPHFLRRRREFFDGGRHEGSEFVFPQVRRDVTEGVEATKIDGWHRNGFRSARRRRRPSPSRRRRSEGKKCLLHVAAGGGRRHVASLSCGAGFDSCGVAVVVRVHQSTKRTPQRRRCHRLRLGAPATVAIGASAFIVTGA